MPSLADRLEQWKFRTRVARDIRERFEADWRESLDHYRTEARTAFPAGEWSVELNFVYAWFESVWPSLTYREPRFTCTPLTEASVESSKTNEAVINGELRRIGFKKAYKGAVFGALMTGIGILQLGYYDRGLVPDIGGGDNEEPEEDETKFSDPPEDIVSDYQAGFEQGSIYVVRHHPNRFLIDPEATSLDDARWCGVEYFRPVDLVKKDPQYMRTKNLTGDASTMLDATGYDAKKFKEKFSRDPELDMVMLTQVWDIVDRKVYTFSQSGEHFHQIRKWPLQVKRFPFYIMHATEDDPRFYNQGPISTWLMLNNEMNLTLSNRIDHMSRNKAKMVYDKGVLSDDALDELVKSRNLGTVGVDVPEGKSIRDVVQPLNPTFLPPEQWQHLADARAHMSQVSGLSEFDVGATRAGERSAEEIGRISAGSDIRRLGLASRLEEPLQCLARDVRALIQQFYTEERVQQITNEFGDSEWIRYSGRDLHGDFSFHVDLEELAPETTQDRKESAAMLLQLLTPYTEVASPIPRVKIDPILKKVAEDLKVSQWVQFYPSAGPPMGPDMEYFYILEKGQDLQPNEADDHAWHIFTHQKQLENPELLRDQEAFARLTTHIERHETMLLAQQQAMQAQQEMQQQSGGGTPGPAAGSPSNNPAGGAGVFGGDPTEQAAAVSGGADGQNRLATLRQLGVAGGI